MVGIQILYCICIVHISMLVIQDESQKKVDLYFLGCLNPKSGQIIVYVLDTVVT